MLVFQAFAKDVPWGKIMGGDTLLATPKMRYR